MKTRLEKGKNFAEWHRKTNLYDWQYERIGELLDRNRYSKVIMYRGWKCLKCYKGIYCIPKATWIKKTTKHGNIKKKTPLRYVDSSLWEDD